MSHTVVTHPKLSQILLIQSIPHVIYVLPLIISHKGHQMMNTTMRRVQIKKFTNHFKTKS